MNQTLKTFFTHFVCWLVFIGTWVFMRSEALSWTDVGRYISPFYALLIGIFYLNYSVLYRYLYRRRKYFSYFLSLVIFVMGLPVFQWMLKNLTGRNFTITLLNYHPSGGLGFLSMMIGSALAISLLIRLGQDNINKEREKQQLLNDRLSIEMDYLKSRVSPHFLLNAMNNIHAMVSMGHPKAGNMVAGVSDILRYLLYQTSQVEIKLSEEIHLIKSFIEIQKIKSEFENAVKTEFTGDFETIKIEPMLLLPLVENAFKHGDYDKVNGAQVDIKVAYTDNVIKLSISNGCSPSLNEIKSVEGLGLRNVRSRLELRYPGKYRLSYGPRGDRFFLDLSIDLI